MFVIVHQRALHQRQIDCIDFSVTVHIRSRINVSLLREKKADEGAEIAALQCAAAVFISADRRRNRQCLFTCQQRGCRNTAENVFFIGLFLSSCICLMLLS